MLFAGKKSGVRNMCYIFVKIGLHSLYERIAAGSAVSASEETLKEENRHGKMWPGTHLCPAGLLARWSSKGGALAAAAAVDGLFCWPAFRLHLCVVSI